FVGEKSWLEDLEGDEVQAEMQTEMEDNGPKMQNMQTVQDFSSTSSYERESVPFDSPGKQVEVEF
ncbi:MAG: hypothetical protein D3904_09205, partial [Candidatus Electrothrix sp. EH2]|nr:hypothetical protein [Candidatus Electrothrix sp. EH2]